MPECPQVTKCTVQHIVGVATCVWVLGFAPAACQRWNNNIIIKCKIICKTNMQTNMQKNMWNNMLQYAEYEGILQNNPQNNNLQNLQKYFHLLSVMSIQVYNQVVSTWQHATWKYASQTTHLICTTGRNWFPKRFLRAICLGAKHNANRVAWNRSQLVAARPIEWQRGTQGHALSLLTLAIESVWRTEHPHDARMLAPAKARIGRGWDLVSRIGSHETRRMTAGNTGELSISESARAPAHLLCNRGGSLETRRTAARNTAWGAPRFCVTARALSGVLCKIQWCMSCGLGVDFKHSEHQQSGECIFCKLTAMHIKFWLTYFAYLLHILHILGQT